MKKRITIFFISLLLLITYVPIKPAVKDIAVNEKKYILVQRQKSTGFDWFVVYDIEGRTKEGEDIVLLGNAPTLYDHPQRLYNPENIFICFGEYISDSLVDTTLSKTFFVNSWNFMYPIKRDSILPSFLNPKYGRTVLDFIF